MAVSLPCIILVRILYHLDFNNSLALVLFLFYFIFLNFFSPINYLTSCSVLVDSSQWKSSNSSTLEACKQ